jgi:DNA mismatch repair protein MLH1
LNVDIEPMAAVSEASPGEGTSAGTRDEVGGVHKIVQLEETVINRIAAGEVVVRPANALKELMENCLDAGSKNILVAAKAGGLKMLRIEDDGHGIRTEDMPILCERFTTSKLKNYEDLSSIGTFGFRGEALASISHVSHVTVTTMTATDSHAQIAQYTDGKLRAPPRPCAGTRGTTIVAEDMFYNNATRRAALGKDSVEHSKLLDVVQKYALHYPKVAFSCRKVGAAIAELQTHGGEDASSLDVISNIYGQSLAKELFPFEAQSEEAGFKSYGYASGPNWTSRGSALTLFINNRLVECPALKRAIDAVYAPVLPRHQHPWVYLALQLDPATVDVNVHPTKNEVQFLHEIAIGERIQEALAACLKERGGCRSFDGKASLGGFGIGGVSGAMTAAPARRKENSSVVKQLGENETFEVMHMTIGEEDVETAATKGNNSLTSNAAPPLGETRAPVPKPTRVRLDHRQRSLDTLWRPGSTQSLPAESESAEVVPMEDADERRAAFEEAQQLDSICQMKAETAMKSSDKLSEALNQSIYVGPVSRDLALLQCGAALSLVNLARVARECAYQRLIRSFGNLPSLSLKAPLPLRKLLSLGILDPGSGYDPAIHSQVNVDALAEKFALLLEEKAEMLQEYLSLVIIDGQLVSLPNALGITNDTGLVMDGLPLFLVRVCCDTNWGEEKACFISLCSLCADFCVEIILPSEEEAARVDVDIINRASSSASALNAAVEAGEFEDVALAAAAFSRKRARTTSPSVLEKLRWLHEAVRNDGACKWPSAFTQDGTVLELVSLDQLYRIFERC